MNTTLKNNAIIKKIKAALPPSASHAQIWQAILQEDTAHVETHSQCNKLIGAIYHCLDPVNHRSSSQYLNGKVARKYVKDATTKKWRAATAAEEAAALAQFAAREVKTKNWARPVPVVGAEIETETAILRALETLENEELVELVEAQKTKLSALYAELESSITAQKKSTIARIEILWPRYASSIMAYVDALEEGEAQAVAEAADAQAVAEAADAQAVAEAADAQAVAEAADAQAVS